MPNWLAWLVFGVGVCFFIHGRCCIHVSVKALRTCHTLLQTTRARQEAEHALAHALQRMHALTKSVTPLHQPHIPFDKNLPPA